MAAKPEVDEEVVEYMNAFAVLNPSRTEFGIALSEMLAYCDLHRVLDRLMFIDVIRAMDAAFIARDK